MTAQAGEAIYRVVDTHQQGWHPVGGPGRTVLYAADYGFKRGLDDRSYTQLEATRGPLRPVRPVTDSDAADVRALLAAAGRRGVTTLAAAVESVFEQIREEQGGLSAPDSYQYARRALLAGREGSWESEVLIEVMLFGNDLNLAAKGSGIDARRAVGPSRRVNAKVRDQLAAIIRRWVTDPEYTEVAETLAFLVSGFCDDTAGQNGWLAVADQWLQPGGLARQNFSACYRLLYSLSEHFDSSLI